MTRDKNADFHDSGIDRATEKPHGNKVHGFPSDLPARNPAVDEKGGNGAETPERSQCRGVKITTLLPPAPPTNRIAFHPSQTK